MQGTFFRNLSTPDRHQIPARLRAMSEDGGFSISRVWHKRRWFHDCGIEMAGGCQKAGEVFPIRNFFRQPGG